MYENSTSFSSANQSFSTFLFAVLSEIYERADWLAEMEELGEGKKHRSVIHLQIASRLREIERLEKAKQ
jgi:Uncharacterised protein family (UPF0193)